jgi:thiamine-monophosphate kinase
MLPGPPAGEVWIGDDTAVVGPPSGALLLTVDTVVEGIHADLALVGIDDLGWRAVSTAVSDIAAMGGVADHLLISIAAPPSTDIEALYRGISEAAGVHGAVVVGGDLSTATQVMIAVTVVGHIRDGGPPVLRSGAAVGDLLVVTGPLGAAAAGLRLLQGAAGTAPADAGPVDWARAVAGLVAAHRRPVARLAEGEVARSCGATAMIDLSDGIASDVRRIAEASGVGVRLTGVPVAEGADEDEAICGGDDYELLFAARDADAVAGAFEAAGLRGPLVVGECVADPTELSLGGKPLKDCGWEHPF